MFISVLFIGGSVWLQAAKKFIRQMTSMLLVNSEFLRYIKHSKEDDYSVSFRKETNFYFPY